MNNEYIFIKMIIADSSAIISLAMNCMSSIMNELDIDIVVTDSVYEEIVTYPMNTKRYALESMRIKKLFSDGIVTIKNPSNDLTDKILNNSNSIFQINGRSLKILHEAEAEALALAKELNADAFLIDERTTRLLLENPNDLKELLSYRNQKNIAINYKELESLRRLVPKIPIIRSTEVAAIAYEKGIITKNIGMTGTHVLEAVLCALKFSGCAISWDEINEYKRIISE